MTWTWLDQSGLYHLSLGKKKSKKKKSGKKHKFPHCLYQGLGYQQASAGQKLRSALASILTGLLNFYEFSPLCKGEQKLGQLLTAGKRKKRIF